LIRTEIQQFCEVQGFGIGRVVATWLRLHDTPFYGSIANHGGFLNRSASPRGFYRTGCDRSMTPARVPPSPAAVGFGLRWPVSRGDDRLGPADTRVP
jgi:hypothetical protein